MNKDTRKNVENIISELNCINQIISNFNFDILDDIIFELEDIKEDEDYKYNNLNESLQQTEKANNMQRAVEKLEESIYNIEEFKSSVIEYNIENIIMNLQNII
mgnify:CR=1 FL=1